MEVMKPKRIATLAVIVTLMLSVAMAAPRNRTTIQLDEPTIVGSAVLGPGAYTVEWNGVGPDVQVSFLQDKETIATVTATVETIQNPYDSFVTDAQGGSRLLVEIDTRTLALHFGPGTISGRK